MTGGMARRLLAGLCLAGVGVALALGVLELGVRLLHLVPDRFWQPDATLGTALIPGASGWWTQEEREFTVPVEITRDGRRDLERPVAKPAGTFRILLLGDSFVEAMQVPLEQTFARQLEGTLNASGHSPVEVISMGVSGYGTASQYLYYGAAGRAFAPDIVLLSFYPGNDVRNNSPSLEPTLRPEYAADGTLLRVGGGAAARRRRGLLGSSAAFTYVRKMVVTRQPELAARLTRLGLLDGGALRPVPLVDGIPVDYWVYAADPPPAWRDAWERTERLLGALRDAVAADHARLMIMVVTAREQIYPADWQRVLDAYPAMAGVQWDLDGPERHVLEWCRAHDVPCIQLSGAFRDAADGIRLHYQYDGHWTPAGHGLAARTVAAFLRGTGWPPAHYAEGT